MNPSATMEKDRADNNVKLEITRVIKAERSPVFNAWTQREELQQWFGPGKMIVIIASADVRVGGAYCCDMQGRPDGSDQNHHAKATGIYKKIIPNELLSFTWRGDWEPAEETLVTVRFRDVAKGNEVTLTHERFASEKSRDGHLQGWTSILDKLANYFAK